MRIFISLIGVLASLLIMAVSGYMNFRYGVIKYSGGVPLDGYLFGTLTAAFDISKALVPLFCAWAMTKRKYVFATLGAGYVLACIVFSLSASTGFITEKRDFYTSSRTATSNQFVDVSQQIQTLKKEIRELGRARPVATVQAALAAERQNRRWQSTRRCTDATASESRKFCTGYNQLKAELGVAEALASKRQRLEALQKKKEKTLAAGGNKKADPQLSFLKDLTNIEGSNMEVLLILIMVILIEFGSAFGLYLSLNHGGFTSRQKDVPPPVATPDDMSPREVTIIQSTAETPQLTALPAPEIDPLEEVAEYSVDRLVLAPNESVSITELFKDYQHWCEQHRKPTITRAKFAAALDKVAEHTEAIEVQVVKRKKMVKNVALVHSEQAA